MHNWKILGECGPTPYMEAATVRITDYSADNSVALVANPGTPDQQIYTVCLAESGAPIRNNHVWLKNWSENIGVPEALVKAGLVELTGETWQTGFVNAVEAKLLEE